MGNIGVYALPDNRLLTKNELFGDFLSFFFIALYTDPEDCAFVIGLRDVKGNNVDYKCTPEGFFVVVHFFLWNFVPLHKTLVSSSV